jgi:SNF family Na+-dependent transporter
MPQTIIWFRVYSIFLALVYVACIAGGAFFLTLDPSEAEMPETWIAVFGSLFILMSLIFAIGFGLGAFLPPKPWAWVYGMVLICIGMTSALFLPFCIPLLIFWLKDPVNEWFGRKRP